MPSRRSIPRQSIQTPDPFKTLARTKIGDHDDIDSLAPGPPVIIQVLAIGMASHSVV